MTLRDAKLTVATLGLTLRKREGEYRVTVRTTDHELAERMAYYTNDINDAVATAQLIVAVQPSSWATDIAVRIPCVNRMVWGE